MGTAGGIDAVTDQQRCIMKIEELKSKTEADISDFIAKKIAELKKKHGKEVSDIQFTAREKMTGLEGYDIKINLI